MFKVLINYNFTPNKEFVGDDYLIYDRSDNKDYLKDFDQSKIKYEENIGQVDFPKLSYLIENYDSLPDVFLWSKSNLFKFITPEEYEKVANNKHFTPILTANHKTYSDEKGIVCYYQDGMYYERADSWFFNQFSSKYVNNWYEWCDLFNLPKTTYIPFCPGGSYILTKERVHRYSRDFYDKMRNMLPYAKEPVEAQCAERSYYLLWK